jgi:endo-1,4-beta-xylanase
METSRNKGTRGLPNPVQLVRHPGTYRLGVVAALTFCALVQGQPAKGANKFLGNITTRGAVRSDFGTYWNQITPENETKWGSVERTRDQMSWGGADGVANYAKTAGIPWKFHTLAWGSQYPQWITGLSQADQLAEIKEWMDESKKKYPDVQMIDVVNEAAPGHAPAPFAAALGGNGASGYEWILQAFRMAHERWPNAILVYNDYNNLEQSSTLDWTVKLAAAAKAANVPLDAIGCQAHGLSGMNGTTLKNNLDKMAATGLPILISEYDIASADDNTQATKYKDHITVMWNHPAVAGITIWGYLNGATWISNSGILNSNGTERPALTWLKTFIAENPNPPNNFKGLLSGATKLRARRNAAEIAPLKEGNLRVFDLTGRELRFMTGSFGDAASFKLPKSSQQVLLLGTQSK